MRKPPSLITVGVIAEEVRIPVDRVCRILRRRRDLRPKAYAGAVRLFDNSTVAAIRYEVNRQDARRASRGGVL